MSLTIILIKGAQLILSLSILVVLHEFGHFITAKLFGCRVEKFYLFFDPWFSLFKKKAGDTEYGIGWLPLGGYVKISGMIDESMDKEQLKQEPQPWEFRSKPAWQRLIIMIAGVTMNLILAFLLFAMVLYVWGTQHVPMNSLKYGLACSDSLAYRLGFRDGDHILAINGDPVPNYQDLAANLIYAKTVQVYRKGDTQTLHMPENLSGQIIASKSKADLFMPRIPALVGAIPDTSPALKAGLRPGDRILAVDSTQTLFFDQLRRALHRHAGQQVQLLVRRSEDTLKLRAPVSKAGTIGFYPLADLDTLQHMGVLRIVNDHYSALAAFPAGIHMGIQKLGEYVRQFQLIFHPSTGAYKGLGGFGTIAKVFAPTWDWQRFWVWTAFLSVILAFMNILPIPALDGGHVLFLLFEMVTGRKPSDRFLEYAQIAGMVILFSLLLFANGMDVWRGIQGWFVHH